MICIDQLPLRRLMATPTLSHHQVPGALGEVLLDVRTGDRASPRPGILILPGFKGFKDFGPFPAISDRLARAGFATISISVSGSGVDEQGDFTRLDRFAANTISAELADVGAVVSALDQGRLGIPRPDSLGLLGHSRGGGVALLFANLNPRIEALATWAAVGTLERWTADQAALWRRAGSTMVPNLRTGQELPLSTALLDDVEQHRAEFDLTAAAGRLQVPWLLAYGTADETVPVEEGRALAQASGGRATTLWLDGALHAFGGVHPFAGMTPHLTRLFDASVSHFAAHLE